MATHEEITESMKVFTENYNKNERLKIMNRDWNRIVVVQATDVDSLHTLTLVDGVVSLKEGKSNDPDLTVISDSEPWQIYSTVTLLQPSRTITVR